MRGFAFGLVLGVVGSFRFVGLPMVVVFQNNRNNRVSKFEFRVLQCSCGVAAVSSAIYDKIYRSESELSIVFTQKLVSLRKHGGHGASVSSVSSVGSFQTYRKHTVTPLHGKHAVTLVHDKTERNGIELETE